MTSDNTQAGERGPQEAAAPSRWSAPHSWAEAYALGWTDYLWASVEVQRAMVEATEALREAVGVRGKFTEAKSATFVSSDFDMFGHPVTR